jgi:4-oxalocrotonate tautomerase
VRLAYDTATYTAVKEYGMPLIRIEILEGRSPERTAALIRRVSAVVVETLEVQPEQVRVLLYELPATHWAVGGTTMAERQGVNSAGEGEG